MAMKANKANKEFCVQLKGQYRWELIFDIDNTKNAGTIKRELQVESEVTMSYEGMVRSLDTKSISASLGLKAGGIFKILELGVNGELNTEVKSEYEKIATTKTVFHKKTTKTDTYEVGANSSLTLYRLIFDGPGVTYSTDTLSTSVKDMADVLIDVKGQLVQVLKDIDVVYSDDAVGGPSDLIQEARGQSADINKGQGGKYVWLRPIWTDDVSQGITGIEFVRQAEHNDDYKDLAKGAGGDYRYLKLLKDAQSKRRITEVGLWRSPKDSNGNRYPPTDRFCFRTEDINAGRGGDYLFLAYNGESVK